MGEALKESRVAAAPYPAYIHYLPHFPRLIVGPVSEAPPGKSGALRPDALTPALSHGEREKTLKKATYVAFLLLFCVCRRAVGMPVKHAELEALQVALLIPGQRPHHGFHRVRFQPGGNLRRIG